jgi:hypothetical protein
VPFLRYPPVVAAPFSLDEQDQPMPTYPCPRPGCGREVGFRVEHLRYGLGALPGRELGQLVRARAGGDSLPAGGRSGGLTLVATGDSLS